MTDKEIVDAIAKGKFSSNEKNDPSLRLFDFNTENSTIWFVNETTFVVLPTNQGIDGHPGGNGWVCRRI